jgi:hypothetical protein
MRHDDESNTPDADLLREMIGFAAQRLMELEVEGLTGAAYGEKSPQRLAQRNGYRDRTWETRADTVELPCRRCAKTPIFRAFSRRVGSPRRHSPRLCRRPMCPACRPPGRTGSPTAELHSTTDALLASLEPLRRVRSQPAQP